MIEVKVTHNTVASITKGIIAAMTVLLERFCEVSPLSCVNLPLAREV